MRTRQLLQNIDRTLDRMDEHMVRMDQRMDEEHRLNREQFERHKREWRQVEELSRAAVERNTRVVRELLLQGEEHRRFLEPIEQGIHAQTMGLLHVLDELRGGRGGSDAAPAG